MTQISRRFKTTLAVLGALLCGLSFSQIAQSQPANSLEPVSEIVVTSTEDGLSIDVRAQAVSAAKVIEELAKKTNADIIIYHDAVIPFVKFEKASPAFALKQVAAAAGLSVQLVGKTYLIEKRAADAKSKNDGVDMVFRDISIKELLSILKEQFDLKIEVSPQVSGKLVAIRLDNETPVSAVEKIARGAKLSLIVTENGVYRIGFDEEKTE